MASDDEINAAYEAINSSLLKLVNTIVPNSNIPFVGNLRQIALERLHSSEGHAMVRDEVKQALAAAEAVRARAVLPMPTPTPVPAPVPAPTAKAKK